VHPLSPSLDHVGFFARRVDDVAFALSLIAGSSDLDPHGRPLPAFHVDADQGVPPLAKPRLRIVRFEKWSRAEPEQQKVFEAAAAKLREAGAVVEEREWEDLDSNWSAVNTILSSEASLIFGDLVERYPDRTSDYLKSAVKAGKGHTAFAYLGAKAIQERLRSAFTGQMSGFDAVLTVPAFGEAPEGLDYTGDAEYCAPWTLIGAPRRIAAGGIWQKRPSAGHPDRRPLPAGLSPASGGEMDRGRVAVRSGDSRDRVGQIDPAVIAYPSICVSPQIEMA